MAILATGDELAPPGGSLGPGRIHDSNSAALLAQARSTGATAMSFGIAPDEPAVLRARLAAAIAASDVVVLSGGVSVGAHDDVRDAFEALGAVELWRVAIQPGKPLAFGRTTAGRGGDLADPDRPVALFGLPGNPVSSFVTFELFVRPVLRVLMGHAPPTGTLVPHEAAARRRVTARLTGPVTKSPGRRAFLRVTLEPDPSGAGRLLAGPPGDRARTCSRRWPSRTAWRSSPSPCRVSPPATRSTCGYWRAREHEGGETHDEGRDIDPMTEQGAPRAARRRLTHVDRSGRPRMVDVSAKPATARRAVAEAEVIVSQDTLSLVIDGDVPKGDVLTVAEMAGVMGGKRTSELIPLCHPIPLTDLVVEVTPDRAGSALRIRATAATIGQTGRGDGGADRGIDRGVDGLRHGQGRGTRRRDPPRAAAGEVRRRVRGVAPPARRGCEAREPGAARPRGEAPRAREAHGARRAGTPGERLGRGQLRWSVRSC